MTSRFAERFEALARPVFRREFGIDVTFSNGSHSVDVTALIGTTTFQREDGTQFETRDYLISVADLILNGSAATPARGNTIVEGTRTYTVTSPDGENAAVYDDENRLQWRVHTVLTAGS